MPGTACQSRSTVRCRSQDCYGSCKGVVGTLSKLANEICREFVTLSKSERETVHWDRVCYQGYGLSRHDRIVLAKQNLN